MAEPRTAGPDHRDGRVYLSTPETDLAIRVARATGRPLLLRGEPGSGKSSLAPWVAAREKWRYYEHVVTSRTQTQDLMWSFDIVRRFADAPVYAARDEKLDESRYVTPGVLWWAFDRESALRRGAPPPAEPDPTLEPLPLLNRGTKRDGAVVLIDEIDKADPDVPNALLVPLGSREFTVTETGTLVQGAEGSTGNHLVIITTNDERELPAAFLRRCVVLTLPAPDHKRLVEIAQRHLRTYKVAHEHPDPAGLARHLADELQKVRNEAALHGGRPPSTAEYLDTFFACLQLKIVVGDDQWAALCRMTLRKDDQPGWS
ncbi:AAA family ATPase [Actinoplanes subglobosus]|uniref:AAA family ATPase n=1 Tax=Actinoplanes subglobosus TaxID=1547892 RepID=A0ABV8J1V2_9ACTN